MLHKSSSSLAAFIWIEEWCYLLSLSLSSCLCSFSHALLRSVTHFRLIFTLLPTGPSAINCVPDWDQGESVAGSAGCIQERGRQGWARPSPEEEVTLSHRRPRPRSECTSKVAVPEDVSHQQKIGCFLQLHLRTTQSVYRLSGSYFLFPERKNF